MSKTIYESIQMDDNLPMRILHIYPDSPLLLRDPTIPKLELDTVHFVPPHWHRSLELTYVVDGGITLRTGDKVKTYMKDSLFIINSGDIHEVSNVPSDNVEVVCLLISNDYVQSLQPECADIRFDLSTTTETHEAFIQLYQDILELYYAEDPFNYLKIQGKLLEVMYLLFTHHRVEETPHLLKKHVKTQELNKKILEYIHENYDKNLSLEMMAKEFHFSREHFARMFKETFDKTFLCYVSDYRLYRAFPEIVNSEKTIEEISLKHGFSSSKSLITQFKKKYQETPMKYRQKNKVVILDHNEINIHSKTM
ncbi:araC-like ligand binding domain-containing protein [Listeria weihenstephanensis FSL R9-0317]|uniref:AraC family transcriptional regulator n=1 Tax=Listeria weihenstephanensis TaxID=1006155 RepID=A0A1S7FWX9_9LIST|nr:AraC family transcriptional regulator [Listeria weihenstephanensis]AQY51938.1 AraC family transcriptional regulator [Listeria weihenstephanensis]EUJ35942.1 araC-like ligand binding domain-containing protein [Listeria weihenstephanensis FSL R9-0317]MBC1499204.1 AraC family transcriptional regulator [Listeria weihenstephanensis]